MNIEPRHVAGALEAALASSERAAGTAAADPRRWLALAVLLTGTLLPPLDFFIVNGALPAIRTDLKASSDVSQLVISVYAAAYAVTLILGGRLGDLYGRKRVFIAGMLGFGVASALCGLAPSPGMLVVGRLLQGISAAIMAPQSLASIHAIFPASEKNRALSRYGATFGIASVGGAIAWRSAGFDEWTGVAQRLFDQPSHHHRCHSSCNEVAARNS